MNMPDRADTPGEENGGGREPMPAGSLARFPVDISREEFARFSLIASTTAGFLRFRRGQMLLFAGMSAFSLLMLAGDLLENGRVDPVLLLTGLFLAAAAGLLFFGAPAYVRRGAEHAYDQSRMAGRSYYGYVTVYPDRVEKQTAHAAVRLNFSEGALYIETRDMLLLLSPRTPAIVLPARCLTPADADGVRRAALAGIPPTRRRLAASLVPGAAVPLTPPADAAVAKAGWDDAGALRVEVDYTREEFVRMAADATARDVVRMLPFTSLAATFAGLIFGLLYQLGTGIFVFLLASGLLCVPPVLGTRSKAGQAYDRMNRGETRLTVLFTPPGIWVLPRGAGEGTRLAWRSVTRAVARADSVEIYAQSAFLRIPKRCIPDFDGLRAFVDRHYPVKPEE